jgi:hypothetical protein
MKKIIKIFDSDFSHAKYTTDYQESKYIEWSRDTNNNYDVNELLFFTDKFLTHTEQINNKNKIGMIIEPMSITTHTYQYILENYGRFKNVLTYEKQILEKCDNAIFYPHCGCWIKEEDHMVYEKSKLLSIISSEKKQTEGHMLRHTTINKLKENNVNLGVYGRGYNPIEYKLDALKDYAFSLIIENCRSDYYFTEKLIDSFMTGTVPIYWGCPSIGDFFNLDGMIIFNNVDELLSKLNLITIEQYNSMIPSIKENFERAKKFLIAEDWIYENTTILK